MCAWPLTVRSERAAFSASLTAKRAPSDSFFDVAVHELSYGTFRDLG